MITINLNKKIKEKLKEFIEEKGCKTYSEAINIMLEIYRYTSNQEK